MFEDVTSDDLLLNLTAYASQGDWPIVAWFMLFSFLEYGSYVGYPPVLWYTYPVSRLPWKIVSSYGAYLMCLFLEHSCCDAVWTIMLWPG